MRVPIGSILILSALLGACTEYVPPIFEEAQPLGLPSALQSYGPRLTRGADGTILLSWMERQEQGGVLRVSERVSGRWGEPVEVIDDPRMFVNWADLPSVTSLGDGRWLAHWLSYSADMTYSYDVVTMQSVDGGDTWSEPVRPHDDGTPTEHGFVTVFPAPEGAGLVWLDGRKTGGERTDDPTDTGMTLRGGVIGPGGELSGDQQIDNLACDCCQTDVALTASGPIAVYRDRTTAEIRDIYISRFADGAWQPPEMFSEDGWEITGCPVNGPEIASHRDFVAIAWFTAAGDVPRVKVRISRNGGRSFGRPIEIARVSTLGHVQIDWIGDNAFAVSWLERAGSLKDVQVRSVTVSGDLGAVHTVGRTAVERTVPQMLTSNGDLLFVWTDTRGEETRLAGVRAEVVYAE